jgi:hypothetical protein
MPWVDEDHPPWHNTPSIILNHLDIIIVYLIIQSLSSSLINPGGPRDSLDIYSESDRLTRRREVRTL